MFGKVCLSASPFEVLLIVSISQPQDKGLVKISIRVILILFF